MRVKECLECRKDFPSYTVGDDYCNACETARAERGGVGCSVERPCYKASEVSRAIDDEAELPGSMTDSLWEKIRNDRSAAEDLCRVIVRLTKDGIKKRLNLKPYNR